MRGGRAASRQADATGKTLQLAPDEAFLAELGKDQDSPDLGMRALWLHGGIAGLVGSPRHARDLPFNRAGQALMGSWKLRLLPARCCGRMGPGSGGRALTAGSLRTRGKRPVACGDNGLSPPTTLWEGPAQLGRDGLRQ